MAEIKVIRKSDYEMRLIIRGVDVAIMNTLRRIMLAEVPCMAVEDVMIIENSSVLQDEILVHRLGLMPLTTDLESYNLPEQCACKSEFGCNLCRAALTLDVEAKGSIMTVYSRDLTPDNPDIKPVSDDIPIVKLAPNQKIKLEAYARLGKGKEHAKWQPVSLCAYKHLPKIFIDWDRCDACGKCTEICPEKNLVLIGERIEVRDVLNCSLCKDCVATCPQNPPAIKIEWEKDAFILDITSTGVLHVEEVVLEAFNIFDRKIEDFLNSLSTKKSRDEND